MRELKFRAWTILEKRGSFIYFDLDEMREFNFDIFDEKPIFQQYTGSKDKDGKKIYEGDIVSYEAGEPNRNDGSFYKSISEVKFENGAFWPRPMKEECEDSWYDYELKNICIIGNIFENPELLGAKQLLR